MKPILYLLLLAAVACKRSSEKPPVTPADLTDKVLTSNLSFPWEIVWGPDDHIWVTERGGKISRINPTNGNVIPLLTINDVAAQGEGGLLGMALHPDFSSTPQVFVAYNYNNAGLYREKIVRYSYSNGNLSNATILLDNLLAAANHNGCRLAFGPDKKLYITTGDAQQGANSQNMGVLNGKVLRINTDGSIPADNPFPGSAIWSIGHRNAQGLVFGNNLLYSSEHGPNNDDEVNIIQKGRNYGWPTVQGFCNTSSEQSFCNANQVAEPIKAWTPTIAVSGMDLYNHDLIPQWKNSLLLCTLKGSTLFQLQLGSNNISIDATNEFYANKYGRLRDVCISPAGKVYLCTSNGSNDKIIEISKAAGK
ncbi:PQQ-dependent sugar dehydrogenase [Pseudoflavitalea sp. G-6-1-2]|uniref:PQQ-dependent sugar dehydrogenase n=1 Tax=Pseudoflavitalea sp. G-6-1-2 TaxID=2728841 RepID=UPI001469C9DF|nr:PQQ-dependent sugar dehydrogenase [Pseudoflavitalea sp. G-6-1-2]NML24018.1 PQQ-dependent sugar dehydrogenase [Pseudoflavitalea sp. G-6-1-2]